MRLQPVGQIRSGTLVGFIWNAEGVRLRGEGAAKKIETIGQATAAAYRKQIEALCQEAVTAIELIKKIAAGNVRITPDILVAGEKGGLLDILLAQFVKKVAAIQRADNLELAGTPDQATATVTTGAVTAASAEGKNL